MNPSRGSLRYLKKDDLEKIRIWRNSRRIQESMFSDHFILPGEQQEWFQKIGAQSPYYRIFELDHIPVGMVYFKDIDSHNQTAYWGFYLGETGLPRGTGLLMGYLGLEYGFNHLHIRKMCSQALAVNQDSIAYHKKLGFIEEGKLVKQIKKSEQYHDVINLALFNETWNCHSCQIIDDILAY